MEDIRFVYDIKIKKKKKRNASEILSEYMLGKYPKMTEEQIQKLIDKKEPSEQGRGAIAFSYKKRG